MLRLFFSLRLGNSFVEIGQSLNFYQLLSSIENNNNNFDYSSIELKLVHFANLDLEFRDKRRRIIGQICLKLFEGGNSIPFHEGRCVTRRSSRQARPRFRGTNSVVHPSPILGIVEILGS